MLDLANIIKSKKGILTYKQLSDDIFRTCKERIAASMLSNMAVGWRSCPRNNVKAFAKYFEVKEQQVVDAILNFRKQQKEKL